MANKYWTRFTTRSAEAGKVPFLTYPFLLMTAAPAVAYVFFSGTNTVQAAVLYSLTVANFGGGAVSLWGAACFAAFVFTMINFLFRKPWAGQAGPFLGVLVWTYAFILFGTYSYWFQAISYALPQLCFWVWHYFRVRDFWKHYYAGLESNPDD